MRGRDKRIETDPLIQAIHDPRLIIESLGEEMVVFDRKSNKAHLLDARAAAVFRKSADGARLSDLEPLMGEFAGAERTALAALAVSELERVGLVVTSGEVETGMSRRAILKSLGSAAALPFVVSILAPTPAAAASIGQNCTGSGAGDCCCGLNCEQVGSLSSQRKCCAVGGAGLGAACMGANSCCSPCLICNMSVSCIQILPAPVGCPP